MSSEFINYVGKNEKTAFLSFCGALVFEADGLGRANTREKNRGCLMDWKRNGELCSGRFIELDGPLDLI